MNRSVRTDRIADRTARRRGHIIRRVHHPAHTCEPTATTTWRWWLGGAAALSVLIRLPMVWTSLGPDEGGYLAIARAWSHGELLYRDVWVDRPQGLLLLFRVWTSLVGPSTESVRLVAIAFGVLLVVCTGVAVRAVAGERAGRYAALVCAVVTATPMLEGYAANGELLSGAMSAAAIALAATAVGSTPVRVRQMWRWSVAGVLAGIAVSLKQSGFDGVVVVTLALIVAARVDDEQRRSHLRRLGAFAIGFAVPVLLSVGHGIWIGWGTWWFAIAGYRLHAQSALSSGDWHNLVVTARIAVPMLAGGLVLGSFGAGWAVSRLRDGECGRVGPRAVMLLIWPVSASAAFLAGGGFWKHYWIQLGPPIAALAGVGIAALPRLRRGALVAVLMPALVASAWVYMAPRTAWMVRAADDVRARLDEQVSGWFHAHGYRQPSLYVLCSSPGLYAETRSDPHYPYLWYLEVLEAPNSQAMLVGYLDDAVRGPRFVAEFQKPDVCDRSGRVARILRTKFAEVADVHGVGIFERVGTSERSGGVRHELVTGAGTQGWLDRAPS